MALSDRQLMTAFPRCSGPKVRIPLYGEGSVVLHPALVEATRAMSDIFKLYGWATRRNDTGGYVCRRTRTGSWSPHAHAYACDCNWQCVTGNTEIVTWDGPQRIGDLAGTTQRLLTRDPVTGGGATWVDAPINAFGEADVFDVVLSRRGVTRTVTTTAEHRWYVVDGFERQRKHWRNREKITASMVPGERVLGCLPRGARGTLVNSVGVAAGNVFGDGTRGRNRDSNVSLFGASMELLRFYPEPNVAPVVTPNGVRGIRVDNLPGYFKEAPPLNESASYLLGWLAGYFAADGSVSKNGLPSITSANREHLELFRLVALRVGVGCGEVRTAKREGYGGVSEKHTVSLLPSTVPERFFVRSDHAERFAAKVRRRSDHLWRVESIEPAGRAEVFCPHVESTGVFALEGFILTGNSNPLHPSRCITDMPYQMVRDIEAIRTNNGRQVWINGCSWRSVKDAMHYQAACWPSDLATGINPRTVSAWSGGRPAPGPSTPPSTRPPPPPPPEDDDMELLMTPQGNYSVAGGVAVPIHDPAALSALNGYLGPKGRVVDARRNQALANAYLHHSGETAAKLYAQSAHEQLTSTDPKKNTARSLLKHIENVVETTETQTR